MEKDHKLVRVGKYPICIKCPPFLTFVLYPTKQVKQEKNSSCPLGVAVEFEVTRGLQHFVFRPRQPHVTELHCQNLVLIAVTKEARPAATHPTKRQPAVLEGCY